MWILEMASAPLNPPLISTVIETRAEEPPPPEYTIEQKIAMNYYGCDESIEWIRADNAQCLAKRVITPPNPQTPVRTPQNGSQGNTYTYGYCTWYVKNQLSWVPNGWGNANQWATNARSQGYTVSNTPIVGAVAQTTSGSLGHVAVVIAVGDGTVTVSEMNFTGWNRVSTRTVTVNSFVYIY
jgi:surface antigen